jgi:hypothetical protein
LIVVIFFLDGVFWKKKEETGGMLFVGNMLMYLDQEMFVTASVVL